MLSFLNTVLIVFVFFLQLCSSTVIRRQEANNWYPSFTLPWWWHPLAPVHSAQSHSVLIPITTGIRSTGATFTTISTAIVPTTLSSLGTTGGSYPTTLSIVVVAPTSTDSSRDKPTTLSLTIGQPSTTKQSPPSTSLSTLTAIPLPISSSSFQQATSSAQSAPTSTDGHWKPQAGTNWQIELSGTVTDISLPVDVFDLDLFDTPNATISSLKQNGKKVICYFSAGSFEDWRPDKDSFLASDKGNALDGWPGEYWLNTSSANVRTIMAARIQLAQDKGCDGVDPDNVDGFDNLNGLGLTQATAVDYLTHLAGEAHSRGLSIGLKNAGSIVGNVLPMMEWQINEECLQYDECDLFTPFIDQNKPVFHIEYPDGAPSSVTPAVKTEKCSDPSAKGFSTVLKTIDLTAWVDPC